MSEEEIKILDAVIKRCEECIEHNNIQEDNEVYFALGNGEFGYLTYNMLLKFRELHNKNKSLKGEIKVHAEKSNNRYKEIKNLEKQLKIKHEGFMASTEEICEYATNWDELKEWIEEQLKVMQKEMNKSSKGLWKYHIDKGMKTAYMNALSKMEEIEKGNK